MHSRWVFREDAMSRTARSLQATLVAVTAAAATLPGGNAAGEPPAPPGALATTQELTETTRLADRRSLVVGDRAYAMSTADTLYPAAGWHIRGEMGGVWSQPIKLVDGVWFRLADKWLGDADGARATKTTAGWGYTKTASRRWTRSRCSAPTSCPTAPAPPWSASPSRPRRPAPCRWPWTRTPS